MQDTIYALSTPVGGAIAVVRLSGPLCAVTAKTITGRDLTASPRLMCRASLRTQQGRVVDEAMAVFLKGPSTYTGEDMLELYIHGGPQTAQAALQLLAKAGLRPAEPGEFTRRAFMNGKMDLTQAEGVMDLISAQAEQSARAALSQVQGRLKDEIMAIENDLLDAQSGIGAAMDYPEEMEDDVNAALPEALSEAKRRIQTLIDKGRAGRVLREGINVVLIGKPNAGKSSLMNALLGRERAIVTDQPGTTRDTIEEALTIRGLPLRLTDTAGLRQARDQAERIGVERARAALEKADIALVLLDDSAPLSSEDMTALEESKGRERLILMTKSDLPAVWSKNDLPLAAGETVLSLSARTGVGLDALEEEILKRTGTAQMAAGEQFVTNERHIFALEQALAALESARDALTTGILDCVFTDLSDALRHLGAITGRDVDEAVIDRIFENFCVGK